MISFNKIVWFERDSPTNHLSNDLEGIYEVIRTTSASETINALESGTSGNSNWHIRKLKALMMYQWGNNIGKIADLDGLQVVFSRSTGKIRYVTLANEIVFTIVPTTGLLTPTFEGGKLLLQHNIDDTFIVTMEKEAAEFVSKGKSALAKFVTNASLKLKAGEEVLVVDDEHQLVGTGRALLSGSEMLVFDRGVAVVIRHSFER